VTDRENNVYWVMILSEVFFVHQNSKKKLKT